jgi:adenine deaminase
MKKSFSVTGNLVDVHQKRIYPAEIIFEGERIIAINNLESQTSHFNHYILPGLVDAHVHIESSMLIPSEFARLAVVHGTVATVSDPHEIANVCGMKGVEYMIENGKTVPFKFNFGAPSCVPATKFETAGAVIDANDIDELMRREEILYLSEMMNFPGVLNNDGEVMKKIASAKKHNKPIDGHAPGLLGELAKKYIDAGISTDHECFTKEEALDKLKHGMKILIREGSAAKNFEALIDLLNDHEDMMMFCSDDKHPDSLVEGHINQLCARAAAKGIDVFKVLQAACVNPVGHYKLKVGLLRQNDFADFIVVKDLKNFEVIQTYINGQLVAENGKTLIKSATATAINNFDCSKKKTEDFKTTTDHLFAIEALDGQLITNKLALTSAGPDIENDILKIVVVNRYEDAPTATAFIKNFGLKKGAIASSVAHDSHNIVAVGVDDESICKAVNLVIENKGGISLAHPYPAKSGTIHSQPLLNQEFLKNKEMSNSEALQPGEVPPPEGFREAVLPLPVAGLMSTEDGYEVAKKYSAIDKAAKELGSKLSAPYMTLSFMALLVIPHLKLSDLGLFDGDEFKLLKSRQAIG